MVRIEITGQAEVSANIKSTPKRVKRAAEKAIDFTARYIQAEEKQEILTAFDGPVDYTINSVKTTLTKGHNMEASVWIATPSRMEDSYLVPQVEGGARKLKGFERGFDREEFVPAAGVANAQGNVPVSTIKKARASISSGKRTAEYVHITDKRNGLWPGIYQRFKTTKGFGRKVHKTASRLIQRGRARGGFVSAVSARGLRPIMLEGRTGHAVKPQFDFYAVAHRTFDRVFVRRFQIEFNRLVASK